MQPSAGRRPLAPSVLPSGCEAFLGVFDALVEFLPDDEFDSEPLRQLDIEAALALLRDGDLI